MHLLLISYGEIQPYTDITKPKNRSIALKTILKAPLSFFKENQAF